MDNKRSHHRRRVLKRGEIVFPGHTSDRDCVVRDLTDTGACLEVESQLGVPEQFDLAIRGDRDMRHCRVAWRKANQIGVAFE